MLGIMHEDSAIISGQSNEKVWQIYYKGALVPDDAHPISSRELEKWPAPEFGLRAEAVVIERNLTKGLSPSAFVTS